MEDETYDLRPTAPVSWRELGLALDPIREDLRILKQHAASKADVRAISADVSELGADVKAWKVIAEKRAIFGGRGRAVVTGLLVSVPSSLVGAVVALLTR